METVDIQVPAPTTNNGLKLAKVIFSAVVGFAATEGAGKVFDFAVDRIKNRNH